MALLTSKLGARPRARAQTNTDRSRLWLRDDVRGGISVEYLVVTSVGLFIAVGLGVLGVAMVDAYGASLQILYSEFP